MSAKVEASRLEGIQLGARAVAGRAAGRLARRLTGSCAALASVAIVVASPRLVSACAVCTSGRDDESNTAFLISTIFLSLLPLAALGTLVFVLWRRIRALEAESGRAEDQAAPTPIA